ncbi:GTPase and tRNA-U34 5-formylation enzyme TrmE [Enterobacter cloacae]|uniref:GTPase and tRNA-U34 5-formylation enzyme TrmE n=1 Tax=Enterobacter cloacae TaxID=550 RepID=A0A377M8J4_ENTCL|nr:GTPase and tRNA-U34 5-formylation enzyme TrmE [Enterobacter cloacae]
MSHNDTIVAQATPPGRGGVGILRISGLKAREVAEAVLGKTAKAALSLIICRLKTATVPHWTRALRCGSPARTPLLVKTCWSCRVTVARSSSTCC